MKNNTPLQIAFTFALLTVWGCGGHPSPAPSQSGGHDENPFANSGTANRAVDDSRKSQNDKVVDSSARRTKKHPKRKKAKTLMRTSYGQVSDRPTNMRSSSSATSDNSDSEENENPLTSILGQPAPDIDIKLQEGGSLNLQTRFDSKILIVVIWATYSSASQRELEDLQKVIKKYANRDVRWLAVNDGEQVEVIDRFFDKYKYKIPVGFDLDQEVADAFQANQLPFLVVIDADGIIQSFHPGYSSTLDIDLGNELADLTTGKNIIEMARDRLNHGSGLRRRTNQLPIENNPPVVQTQPSDEQTHQAETYQLTLKSGRTIDLKEIFTSEGKEFEKRLARMRKKGSLLTTYYEERQPQMMIGNASGSLNGPTAAFYVDGTPMIYLDYVVGQRTGTLFTWDEQHRPWVFTQYESGKKHGYCCAFRACSEECTDGHIWLIQEWERDSLRKSHLAIDSGEVLTFDHLETSAHLENDEYATAAQQISDFERDLRDNEIGLKKSISQYGRQVARARRAAALSAQRRNMAMMGSAAGMARRVPVIPVRTGGSC